jgi:uncharacterized protein (TIGR03084 family)
VHEILAALAEQQAELDSLINPTDEAAWAKPSRCDGWSVSDVVLHLAQTNEMALASLDHALDAYYARMLEHAGRIWPPTANVDDGAGAMVDKERGAPPADVYRRWRDGVDALMKAFADADPHDRVPWVAGTLSAHTLSTTRLAETWIHTNDVAFGVGVALPSPDRLKYIARLAWRTLPYAFTRAGRELTGTVAFELTAPDGSDWVFGDDSPADTIVRGTARDLCEVAGQRATASETSLTAEGPDAESVLELVRTFA